MMSATIRAVIRLFGLLNDLLFFFAGGGILQIYKFFVKNNQCSVYLDERKYQSNNHKSILRNNLDSKSSSLLFCHRIINLEALLHLIINYNIFFLSFNFRNITRICQSPRTAFIIAYINISCLAYLLLSTRVFV